MARLAAVGDTDETPTLLCRPGSVIATDRCARSILFRQDFFSPRNCSSNGVRPGLRALLRDKFQPRDRNDFGRRSWSPWPWKADNSRQRSALHSQRIPVDTFLAEEENRDNIATQPGSIEKVHDRPQPAIHDVELTSYVCRGPRAGQDSLPITYEPGPYMTIRTSPVTCGPA